MTACRTDTCHLSEYPFTSGSLKTDWFQFPTEMISSDFLFVNTETPTSLAGKEYTQTYKSGSSVFQGLRGTHVTNTDTLDTDTCNLWELNSERHPCTHTQ